MTGLLAADTGSNAALIIAICSAAIALTSLTWNLLLYRLSGSRLNVRLIPAVLTARGDLVRGPDRGWPAKHLDPLPEVHPENGYVDLAVIKVTNVGRVAVSVSDIVLDFGRTGWRWWWRRTIGATPVVVHECKRIDGDVRLEAGQSFSVAVDHEPLVRYIVGQVDGKRVAVRASATAAGRRPTRSSWRKRWKLKSERSIYFESERGAEHDAFVEVFRAVYPHDAALVYEAWIAVTSLWLRDPNAGAREIAGELADVLGREQDTPSSLGLTLAAHQIAGLLPDELTLGTGKIARGAG